MKREYRNAIKRGIEKSELNGYMWSIKPAGLKWSYLDTEFVYIVEDDGEFLSVRDHLDQPFISIWYGDDKYADCKTLEEAYELATTRTIKRANHLY